MRRAACILISRTGLSLAIACGGFGSSRCLDFAVASRCYSIDSPCPAECEPCPASSRIAFVQASSFEDADPAKTVSLAFDAPTTAGDLIVVVASWGDHSALDYPPEASDSAGNVYTVATKDFERLDMQSLAIFYAADIAGGASRVTVSFNAPGYPLPNGEESFRSIAVAEYRGVDRRSPLITTAHNVFTDGCSNYNPMEVCKHGGFIVTSSSAEVSIRGALIFGATMNTSAQFADRRPGMSFTQRAATSNDGLAIQDRLLTSTGTVASTEIWQLNSNYIARLLAFKPASASE
jgi:hypothetical protein